MRILKTIAALATLTAAVLLTACSDESPDKLEYIVADDADIVVTGDISRLVATTGSTVDGNRIAPSATLNEAIAALPPYNRKAVGRMLEFKGFDWSDALLTAKTGKNGVDIVIVWSVTDADAFAKSLCEEEPALTTGKHAGYTTVGTDGGCLLLKDNLGFMAIHNGKPCSAKGAAALIDAWHEKAEKQPIADWKKEKLRAANIINVMVAGRPFAKKLEGDAAYHLAALRYPFVKEWVPKVSEGILFGSFDIEGQSATARLSVFDTAGKELDIAGKGKIDTSLLKYGTEHDVAVAAIANTEKIASFIEKFLPRDARQPDREPFDKIVKNLNGSAVLMAGPKTADITGYDRLSNWSIVFAAHYKDQGAAQAVDYLAQLARTMASDEFRLATHQPGHHAAIDIVTDYEYNDNVPYFEDGYMTPVVSRFFAFADGDVLVISNDPISLNGPGTAVGKKVLEGDNSYAAVVDLGKGRAPLSAFNTPFGVNATLAACGNTVSAEITLTDTDRPFMEAILKVLGSQL